MVATASAALAGCIIVDPDRFPEQRTSPPPTAEKSRDRPVTADVASLPAAAEVPRYAGVAAGTDGPLDVLSLQAEILAFSDRFLEAVAESMDRAGSRAATAEERALYQQIKVVYVTSAITIASEPDPLRSLQEFLVFLELACLVWEDEASLNVSAEVARHFLATLSALRSQVVTIGNAALSEQSIAAIRALAVEWRRANPGRSYVAFVRFSDLGTARQRAAVEREIRSRGLLAPVANAAREMQQFRLVSERAIFLANHMPILLEWQSELFVDRSLATPEVQALLADIGRFVAAAEGVDDDLADLVDLVSAERVAAIDHFAEVIERERGAMLADFVQRLEDSGSRFRAELENSADRLLPLATKLSSSFDDLRRILELLEEREEDGEDLDLDQLEETIEDATLLSESLNALTAALGQLIVSEGQAGTLERVEVMLRRQERRIFGYAALLVLLIGTCVIAVVWTLRKLDTK